MRTASLILFMAIIYAILSNAPVQAETLSTKTLPDTDVSIIAQPDVYNDYILFLNGRSPIEITDYSGAMSRRDVIELVLVQQALALGGLTQKLHFKIAATYIRAILELQLGNVTLIGNSAWLSDLAPISKNIFISAPVIKDGDFEAGLYTSVGNFRGMAADTLTKIKQLSAVGNKTWKPDWEALKALNLKELHHIPAWKTMVRTVSEKRIDFLLAPFQQTPDMILDVDGMLLTPIHGVKISLRGSRHFAVSKTHPHGKKIFAALEKGLRILHERGTIEKAYSQCGFFNKNVRDWKRLN